MPGTDEDYSETSQRGWNIGLDSLFMAIVVGVNAGLAIVRFEAGEMPFGYLNATALAIMLLVVVSYE